MLFIALYATFADGTLDKMEAEIIEKTAMAFNISFALPDTLQDLPPAKDVICCLKSTEEKITAIELAVRIMASNGEIKDEEASLLHRLYLDLSLGDEVAMTRVLGFMREQATLETEWNCIWEKLRSDTRIQQPDDELLNAFSQLTSHRKAEERMNVHWGVCVQARNPVR